jgi:hypothetical protein
VADLPVTDLENHPFHWEEWEKIYGINLHPRWLLGQPALMEIRMGQGRLILSYPHLETPDDPWGNRLFLNILNYLDEKASCHGKRKASQQSPLQIFSSPTSQLLEPPTVRTLNELARIQEYVDNLISFGERHLLWKWRNAWLLHWCRGIRGLEYGTLAFTVRILLSEARKRSAEHAENDSWLKPVQKLKEEVHEFCHLSRQLLLEEKLALQTGGLTKLGKVNEKVDRLRSELFGNKMTHGGLCRIIFDRLDWLLLQLLRQGVPE